MTEAGWAREREGVPRALEHNRVRRERADAERREARDELRDLLARGQAVAIDVAPMAQAAGVSRETAHRLLREAGSLSFRHLHRLATAADIPQGPQRAEWFREQGFRMGGDYDGK